MTFSSFEGKRAGFCVAACEAAARQLSEPMR
jgi:hypothetical protein